MSRAAKQVRLERIVRPENRGVQVGRIGFFRILGLELPGLALNRFSTRSRVRKVERGKVIMLPKSVSLLYALFQPAT